MAENPSTTVLDGEIIGIRFSLANHQEICTASISDCPISHASQLGNPFLGLPLEYGKCESCGTAEPGKCEGHFGYIELPIPVYHPCHVTELKRMLSLLCLKCLKMKNSKFQLKSNGLSERLLSSCCEEASQISIKEEKKPDGGACYLQLKLPSKSTVRWDFLERYGYRFGDGYSRTLLASEVMEILKKIPEVTRKKLAGKGYFPQDGYIVQYLPVPPNCLSVPDISDGVSIMSSDQSITMLKKVLKQVEIIKSSRSGTPTFEAHEVEANDLQCVVEQYLQVRGTAKKSPTMDKRFGIKESNDSSTKAWLEKMRTLFIRKGSGFSSRSVITGDAYNRVNEIGLPFEIAQRITFEEKVTVHNMKYLQDLVDNKLCLTYRDGVSTYSLREGSTGHTFLRPGQVVHRRIMDGDTVFINRPPTTHKHALQALSVYVHDDHTVKINPLICAPLSADFDGDCVHLFYPQSLAAKAEVLELFSVEKQLLSSHSGNLTLQLVADSLLSLKMLFKMYFLDIVATQQLAMFSSASLPLPALFKTHGCGPHWTALQILQTALPDSFDCHGERHLIVKSSVLKFDLNRDVAQSLTNDVLTSLLSEKGPNEVLRFLNTLQPLLMENLYSEGFSIGLKDFAFPLEVIQDIQKDLQDLSPLLYHLRSVYDEVLEKRLENDLRLVKVPATNFILQSPALGYLIDSKSDSAINKVVQQIGFLGLQLSDHGKFYTRTLVEDMASLFRGKYPFRADYPSGEHGLVKSCFFHGLDPYEKMVHSISSREVLVRSSRGLAEPGTLFKNLMAILRDVVICYDGTVRNVSSNSIIQFEYGVKDGSKSLFPAGEPVGVLAATAMSTPAYKAVLDSSPSSNSSWELMKEVLLCRVNFKNDPSDRRVILYLNDCGCGRKYCREHAAFLVGNQLKKVSLKDAAVEFTIEYKTHRLLSESSEMDAGLTGHVHLNKDLLDKFNISMQEVYQKCQESINSFRKKKQGGNLFKRIALSVSECCSFQQPLGSKWSEMPCLMFYWKDASDIRLEKTSHILADIICPVLLQTIIKGDPRIGTVNIMWISPDTTTWIRNPCTTQKGELVLDIVLEKAAVKQSGDAWRIILDSCLPVLHLIDANRSIPYGIKQVQELLGISCAFDQAVQRLSTSVAMVTKGVLREHLILLANSMTCAGNLVGFNIGGYKALSRSLNVQVPFTEATLFTPRRCFERAAEKCHMDALSSIVASCSWGRQVTVGTGSRFELLWDTKEVGHQQAATDVYNLLHLVRRIPNGSVSDTGCLGADVDDIGMDDENQELVLSPEQNSDFAKAVFEDGAEFQHTSENLIPDKSMPNESTWDRVAFGNADSDGSGDWAVEKHQSWGDTTSTSKPGAWCSWGSDKSKTLDNLSSREPEGGSQFAGWDDMDIQKGPTDSEPSAGWEKKVEGADKAETEFNQLSNAGWNDMDKQKKPTHSETSAGWGKKVEGVGKAETEFNQLSTAGWNDMDKQKKPTHSETSAGWGKKVEGAGKAESEFNQLSTAGWNDMDKQKKPTHSETSAGWGKKVEGAGKAEFKFDQPSSFHAWDSPKTVGWGTSNELNQPANTHAWDAPKAGGGNENEIQSQWGQLNFKKNHSENSCGWAKNGEDAGKVQTEFNQPSTAGWDDMDIQKGPADPQPSADWSKVEGAGKAETEFNQPSTLHGWGSPKTGGWGTSNELNQSANSHAWDSPTPSAGGGNENGIQSQWGQQSGTNIKKNWSQNSRGWGSLDGGDWKIKKNQPPKSPGMHNDDSSVSGVFTASRQRFDRFTSEEQPILSDVEPIMQSIRRIMHQSGYNDGDRLSADDQLYILENVFVHHPDKAVKMGSGVDYVMVSKHSKFQGTRCFYIVSTDGRTEDFSSRKCVENFVQGKYPPEHAESFIKKYFRRNREQNQNSEETGNRNREQNQTPDETGNRNREQTQTPDETGNQMVVNLRSPS